MGGLCVWRHTLRRLSISSVELVSEKLKLLRSNHTKTCRAVRAILWRIVNGNIPKSLQEEDHGWEGDWDGKVSLHLT